ncbi:hypothetical protein DPMN_108857 [Dreissena polymorpha]|uniref:Uncharacterized protein n=1 Tax=Dreissena polymorpha TaxID=45954 RepID=A0A9D4K9P7_DREPO|nr:hypothetical protein DPMN_108857 [Dreissena polymorpha]
MGWMREETQYDFNCQGAEVIYLSTTEACLRVSYNTMRRKVSYTDSCLHSLHWSYPRVKPAT